MNDLKNIKIAVFGQGKMGLPLASVFAEHGIDVIGVDIDQKVVDKLNAGINHITEEPGLSELVSKNVKNKKYVATTDGVRAAIDADIMVILVPTLIDERGNIKLDPVYGVTEIISKGLKKGNIVITEATMPPGTTEKLIPILEKSGLKLGEFGLSHAPERTMTGTALRDIKGQYPKIIGCSDERTYDIVSKLYNLINKKGTIKMSSINAAETVKVFEGVYRDVNIGLSNEMALWCEEHSINALEVFDAANTQPFCHFHTPGAGVGGHCIPVYPWFIINTSNDVNPRITKIARELNDFMAHHMVELTIKGLNEFKKCLNGINILVLGLTFRGGVKEFMKSAAIPIINELNSLGANVYSYDPLCNELDYERFNSKLKTDFNGIDAIIVTSDHEEFKHLDFEKISKEVSTKLVIDGRNIINVSNAIENGFRVIKVGNIK